MCSKAIPLFNELAVEWYHHTHQPTVAVVHYEKNYDDQWKTNNGKTDYLMKRYIERFVETDTASSNISCTCLVYLIVWCVW